MTPLDPAAAAAGFGATLLMVLWPAPLLMAALRAFSPHDDEGPAGYDCLFLTTGWWSLQLGLGMAMGFAGLLQMSAVTGAQSVLLVVGVGLWWRGRGQVGAAARCPDVPRRLDGAEGAVLFILLVLGFVHALRMLRSPTANFDSLTYHLPVMANWVRQGTLDGVIEIGHVGMYPSHFELMSTLFFLPWKQDLLVSLPGLIAWGHAGLALYVLWRLWGAGPMAAMVPVALFLLVPDVLIRLDAVQPDVAVVGLWTACAAGTTRWLRTGSARDLALAAMAAGVLLGLKLSAAVHLLLLLVPVLWAVRRRRPSMSAVGRPWLIAALALALFTGAGWYARNLVQTGNPAGLVEVQLGGRTFFEGSLSAAELARGSLARVFRWSEVKDWSVLGGVFWRGYGPAGAALILLAAAGLVSAVRSRTRSRWVTVILLMVLAEAALYWLAPYSADNGSHNYRLSPWMDTGLRYGYLVAGLLTGLAAVGLQAMGGRQRLVGLGLVTAAGLWSGATEAHNHPGHFWMAIVVALGAIALIVLRGWPKGWSRVLALHAVALCTLCAIGVAWWPARDDARADLYGPVYVKLVNEGVRYGLVAVNSQELIRYTGRDWRRRVTVSTPGVGQSVTEWLTVLRAEGYGWLVIGTATASDPAVAEILAGLEVPGVPVTRILDERDLEQDERLYRIELR